MTILQYLFEKYPNKPWDWDRVSSNPNITMEFIEKNLDNISFQKLSHNKLQVVS